jgi:hypothetical protein
MRCLSERTGRDQGERRKPEVAEYNNWKLMKQRCANPEIQVTSITPAAASKCIDRGASHLNASFSMSVNVRLQIMRFS